MNRLFVSTFPSLVSMGRGDGLELSYESQESIPAGYENLYSEKDGKFVLTGVKGVKTQADIENLQTALNKERTAHKATKQQYAPLANYGTIEDITANLDRIPELEAKQGKGAPEDIEKIVSARLAPVQRELENTKNQLKEKDGVIETYKGKEVRATIADTVRKAAKAHKVLDTALEDAIIYGERVLTVDEAGNVVTKEGVGVTPFVTADELIREILPNRPHWLGESYGGGSRGGKGQQFATDPYSHDGWNISEQMKLYKENPTKAQQMAKRHGVDVTNPVRPAKKS